MGFLYTAVHKYKEKYESDSSQSKQAAQNWEFTQGMSPAGCRWKRVMSKGFEVQDGVEYFEVHKGEWVRTDSQPMGPCKTLRGKGTMHRQALGLAVPPLGVKNPPPRGALGQVGGGSAIIRITSIRSARDASGFRGLRPLAIDIGGLESSGVLRPS